MLAVPYRWIKLARARLFLLYILLLAVLAFVLLYHSGSAPNGLSAGEAAARTGSRSLSAILNNPLNAPHKLAVWSVQKAGFHSISALRWSSAVWAVIFALAFWSLARSWFGKTVGLLGAVIFFSTPIFIIAGRQASAEIMWLMPVLVMAAYNWLVRTSRHRNAAWFGLILACGLALYIPGLIWWLVVSSVLIRQRLVAALADVSRRLVAVGLLILAIMLVPAGIAIFKDWHIIKLFALVPSHWAAPLTILKNLGWMVLSLPIRTPYHSPLLIDRLPMLDIIQIVLVLFGLFALWTAARKKALALIAAILFGVLAAGLNNQISLLILSLPAIAVTAAAGLRFLFIEWRSVFPANPIPKTLALALMIGLTAAQLVFGATYGVVAWPHTVDTKNTYVLK